MNTIIDDSGQHTYRPDYVKLKNALRPAIDKLRSAQFRDWSARHDLYQS